MRRGPHENGSVVARGGQGGGFKHSPQLRREGSTKDIRESSMPWELLDGR